MARAVCKVHAHTPLRLRSASPAPRLMANDDVHDRSTNDPRRAAIVHDLEIRLRPICDYWPDDLFRSMVDGLADVTLKYEGVASPSIFDYRAYRLVDDARASLGHRGTGPADGPRDDR
jgi:hypothetical protein